MRKTLGILLAFAILLVIPIEGVSQEVSGWGGFPLSDYVTSLWLNGPPAEGRPQPLIMVYYRGPAGWHKRKWDLNSNFGKSPAWIRLRSSDGELSIEYNRGGADVKVQGQAVNLSSSTVFLVTGVESQATPPLVQPLGDIRFAIPSGSNPAIHVLQTNPEVAARVLR